MSRLISAIVLILVITSSNKIYCQLLTAPQRRIINESLLELVNDYEKYSRFTSGNSTINDNYVEAFKGLFKKNAMLYIDILPSNKISDTVDLTEYINLFRKYYSQGIGIKLHNILFESPVNISKDNYRIRIEVDKEIYGYIKTNINYSDTIPLIFTIEFKFTGNNVTEKKISGIAGDPRGRFLKFKVFKFLTLKPLENAEIRIDSKITRTNENGVAFIEDIAPGRFYHLTISKDPYKKIESSNIDIDKFIEGNNGRKHRKLKYDYYDPNEFIYFINTLNFFISPIISLNIPGIRNIINHDQNAGVQLYNLKEKWSFSPRFGMHLGVVLLRTSALNLTLSGGFEKSYVRGSYSMDSCHFETPVIDNQGSYIRKIDLYDQEQKIKLNYTEFPILLGVNFKLSKTYEISTDFGIRISRLHTSVCSIRSGYSKTEMSQQPDTVFKKVYNGFISTPKSLAFQFGLRLSKEISPAVKLYASPVVFIYNRYLINKSTTDDIISSDGDINNILFTYKRSKVQYFALEFGLIYNFNSLNLTKRQ